MSSLEFFLSFNALQKDDIRWYILHFSCILFLNLISYLYIGVRFFKLACYSKLTFEWLPMLNPYKWPFSLFTEITTPYFKFWSTIFPALRFQNSSLEISAIVALETLNSLIYFFVRAGNSLVHILQDLERASSTTI
jgi:hypothetical protein